jgi:hypothetical protein
LLDCLIEGVTLGLGVVVVRAHKICAYLELFTGPGETGARSLPIRNLQIGGYEYEVFVGIMSPATKQGSEQQPQPKKRMQLAKAEHRSLLRTAKLRAAKFNRHAGANEKLLASGL